MERSFVLELVGTTRTVIHEETVMVCIALPPSTIFAYPSIFDFGLALSMSVSMVDVPSGFQTLCSSGVSTDCRKYSGPADQTNKITFILDRFAFSVEEVKLPITCLNDSVSSQTFAEQNWLNTRR